MDDINLNPPEYWSPTDFALEKARVGMDNRAKLESIEVLSGESIEVTHEQAVRDHVDIDQLIKGAITFLQRKGKKVQGVVVDVGSGTGVGAALLSQIAFDKIYALEISEQFVVQIMPIVFNKLNADEQIIQRVVGDFNNIQLPNGSVDLIFDLDSFHHSEDLNVTLQECYRVLKPDGVIIVIDRGWDDNTPISYLDNLLDTDLNPKLKEKYRIPLEAKFTRRDWGEHEYRLMDWESFFYNNGFNLQIFSQKHPPCLNRLFLQLPTFNWSINIAVNRSKRGITRHIIYGFNKNRRLMIARKIN